MKKINPYKIKSTVYTAFAVFFVFLGLGLASSQLTSNKQVVEEDEIKKEPAPKIIPEIKKESLIKDSVYIEVPYTVQAPNKRWDIHEESCEEAAALMYHEFLKGSKKTDISAATAHDIFLKMIAWQKAEYGKEPDLSIVAFKDFMTNYYGHKGVIKEKATKEDFMKVLSEGHPVVIPAMTHSLNNPNYGREDSYHLLLIKGYDKKGVITNDAGISSGKNQRYSWEVIFKAMDAQSLKMKQGRALVYFLN